jgi:hypothetical protein
MKAMRVILWLGLAFLLSACGPSASTATPEVVTIYSTFAAEPWLAPLYECAETAVVLNRVDDPATAQIALRVGEPAVLSSLAYQIDTEEILIVTHRQSPVQNLNLEDVRALFSGLGDPSLQVWVYASDADVQEVFDQLVMEGRVITSSARIAVHPQQMSDALVNEANTVGILPRHWKASDSREIYPVGTVPVLALTRVEPQGVVKDLLTCAQN